MSVQECKSLFKEPCEAAENVAGYYDLPPNFKETVLSTMATKLKNIKYENLCHLQAMLISAEQLVTKDYLKLLSNNWLKPCDQGDPLTGKANAYRVRTKKLQRFALGHFIEELIFPKLPMNNTQELVTSYALRYFGKQYINPSSKLRVIRKCQEEQENQNLSIGFKDTQKLVSEGQIPKSSQYSLEIIDFSKTPNSASVSKCSISCENYI